VWGDNFYVTRRKKTSRLREKKKNWRKKRLKKFVQEGREKDGQIEMTVKRNIRRERKTQESKKDTGAPKKQCRGKGGGIYSFKLRIRITNNPPFGSGEQEHERRKANVYAQSRCGLFG